MKRTTYTPRQIAPRLINGDSRETTWLSLPDIIKAGIVEIALAENQSTAWVIEQCLIDYFGLRWPLYRQTKRKTTRKVKR